MTTIAQAAEAYLQAKARYDAAKMYGHLPLLADGGNYGTRVSWQWGASTPGYKEVERFVQQHVEQMLPTLVKSAMDSYKFQMDEASTQLRLLVQQGEAPV